MKTPYFDRLVDDFGIWQHTKERRILKRHGYALDDAARGLIACLALGRLEQATVLFHYLEQSYMNGHLYGFARADHTFFDYPASEDATGQTIWAMGYAYHLGFQRGRAKRLIKQLQPALAEQRYVRGSAYGLLGALYVDIALASELLAKLQSFFTHTSPDWPWPEAVMTYGNGIVPYAFLRHGLVNGNQQTAVFGRQLLQFVQTKCESGRQLGPIGNNGWLPKDAATAPTYSQQPIDTAYMIWAWIAAAELSGSPADIVQAERWWEWYEGRNIVGQPMYNPRTLQAYDGIEPLMINHDSGAESNICLLLSMKMLGTKQSV